MRAVKAGYSFNLFQEEDLSSISLEQTKVKVRVDGETYPLYRGINYEESQKIDRLLDEYGELPIREYKVREKEMER